MKSSPQRAEHATPTTVDGFEVLDLCHRQTVLTLGKLAELTTYLSDFGLDAYARALATEVIQHFAITARHHHEDEERHIFPQLVATGDPATVQAVLRLQQDHDWIEEDWMELSPHLNAVASGQTWYDLDILREGVHIFNALMHDHIALEESRIYPQARQKIREGDRLEMGREMAARRRADRKKKVA